MFSLNNGLGQIVLDQTKIQPTSNCFEHDRLNFKITETCNFSLNLTKGLCTKTLD